MLSNGIVSEIKDGIVTICIYKDSSCSKCSVCSEKNKISNEIKIKTKENLEVGDEISFFIDDKKILGLGLLIYIFPLIMLFLLYFIAFLFKLNEALKIVSGFAGLIVAFILIFIYDKKQGVKIEKNIDIKKIKRKS